MLDGQREAHIFLHLMYFSFSTHPAAGVVSPAGRGGVALALPAAVLGAVGAGPLGPVGGGA